MKSLVFATNNKNKLREIREIIGNKFEVLSLEDINCHEEIPETCDTIEGNALQKAHYIKDKFGMDCFADDTGLEVAALNGEPGVYSARYAGENVTPEQNIDKLLSKMEGVKNRSAKFRTVIAFIHGDVEKEFEGQVSGSITTERHGEGGFGYDKVFQPENSDLTFAEMTSEAKNKISHRGNATKLFVDYLNDEL